MVEEKINQILDEIRSLKDGQKKNYDLIQKNGVKLEKLDSDIKAVADGHQVIRSEMRQGFNDVKEQIRFVDDKLKFAAAELGGKIDRVETKLDEHIKVSA